MKIKNKKLYIFIAIALAIIIANHFFSWSDYLSDIDNLYALQGRINENYILSLFLYTVITIISCVLLALPGVSFAIVAGVLFGPVAGTLICSLATTVGAMLAFIAARYFLKDSIRPIVMKNKYIRKYLFSDDKHSEFFILMLTRLLPIFPYNIQNFAYGITDISLKNFTVGSLIFMLPGTAMYTIGAAGFGDEKNRWLYIAIAVLLFIAVSALTFYLKKKYNIAAKDKEQVSLSEQKV